MLAVVSNALTLVLGGNRSGKTFVILELLVAYALGGDEGSSVSIPKDRGALQLQRQLQAWALEAEDPGERFRRIVCEELSAATKWPWWLRRSFGTGTACGGPTEATRPRRSDPLTPGVAPRSVGGTPSVTLRMNLVRT